MRVDGEENKVVTLARVPHEEEEVTDVPEQDAEDAEEVAETPEQE